MKNAAQAPKMITWIISLVLFIVALAAHFGAVNFPVPVAVWSWIIGYGLLLVACQVRGL